MKTLKIVGVLLLHIYIGMVATLVLSRCAQTVNPTGGAKDTTPPKLIKSIPENKSTDYRQKTVELFFDEYVIVDNIQQKLIITPETDNPYTHQLKGQSILLKFKKNFEDSTTYTLNFADAIRDFSERNPAKNLKFVFSTGPTLDSANVQGVVRDLKTNLPVLDALVGLYKLNDSLNPERQKPYYFSRTDSSGLFRIENVLEDKYRLIVLDDKNRNLLYNPKDERIGFLRNAIRSSSDSSNYEVPIFLSDVSPLRVQRSLPKVNSYGITFNKGLDKLRVNFRSSDSPLPPSALAVDTLPYLLENQTTLTFFNTLNKSDTLTVQITATDSVGQEVEQVQKVYFLEQRGSRRQSDPFTVRTIPDKSTPLTATFSYTFQFNKPIGQLLADSIRLQADSLPSQTLSQQKWKWNTYRNELSVEAKAPARDSIRWVLPKGTVISVVGDTLPALLLKHSPLNENDYGQLSGRITADTATRFIVELLDKENKVVRQSQERSYRFRLVPPGEYKLRVIVDQNRNGRWDTGIFSANQPAETILYFPSPVLVKSNFELDDYNFEIPPQTTD